MRLPIPWPVPEPKTAMAVSAPAVVLDTNAVLDWLVFADPRIEPLALAIRDGSVRWLSVPRMRAELGAVLSRPAIAGRAINGERVLTLFDRLSISCPAPPPAAAGLLCSDGDDQIFIDLATEGKARWLVSRDKALLALRKRALARGLIVSVPEDWRLR